MLPFNDDCMRLVMRSESCKLTAYPDTGKPPVWTLGWGHTHGVKPGDTCTQEQANDWLSGEVQGAWEDLQRHVRVELTQGQVNALTDFVFNLGIGQFLTSTLGRKLNAGDYAGAAAEFAKWIYDDGVVQNGLITRRQEEWELFVQ